MEHAKRQTVLVTGATGFLGGYLVRRLTKRYRVLALGRDQERGRELEACGAVFCPGDFTRREECAPYFAEADYVIHAGALSTVWGKWEDFYQTNVLGTDLTASLCMEKSVKRLVYLSSPSIYTGREDQYDIREEQAPEQNELNGYIRSKLMAEKRLRRWEKKGLEIVILRPRGLIGIGDTSLVPRILKANRKTGIPLFREGRNLVDITSVENAALACELALTAEKAAGRVFNITNGEPMEFREILELFLDAIGDAPHYRRLPFELVYALAGGLERVYRCLGLAGEPPLTRYTVCTLGYAQTMDIRPAKEILGYEPEKTLAESIREYGAWWRAQQETKDAGGGKEPLRGGEPEDLTGPGRVKQVRLYACGSCTNNLGIVFRGMGFERREFPARAALIRHEELGEVLYDTGYSEEIFRGGIGLTLYRLLNPVHVTREETIGEQLKRDGIAPENVKHILLSHAHPDHVGGLAQFSGYELTALEETLEALREPKVRDLMFPELVPQRGCIRTRRTPKERLSGHFLCRFFEEVYDLFGDGSLIGVRLPGHCKGQMGLWIPDVRLFLAADACWGRELVRATKRMRLLPRRIQKDFPAYEDSLRRICRMKRAYPGIRVVFTHQKGGRERYG